jgi:hypothetical protein
MPPRKRPEPPETSGTRLRRKISATFELNAAEEVLLEAASALADTLQRVNDAVASSGLVTTGSKGQEVPAPLLGAQREHSRQLAALLSGLSLPEPGEKVGRSPASRSARRAAQARWGRS